VHRHNGLDLYSYEAADGAHKTICRDTKVPILYEGRIVRSIKDFIGSTLFAAHEIYDNESQLFTIYGHVIQTEDIPSEKLLAEGTVIATLAGTENMKVPHHLHLSVALIPKAMVLESLTWQALDEADNIIFFDPLDII